MLVKAWVIPLVCLDYEIRKDYIAKTLCVNKNKPILLCNGKCYLAKKLAQAEKQEQRQAEQDYMASLIYQVMDVKSDYSFTAQLVPSDLCKTQVFDYKSTFLGRLFAASIFRPPLA